MLILHREAGRKTRGSLSSSLLARFAENIYWLARYIERAENLARMLDVTETHARNEKGVQDWAAILEINSDTERFRETYNKANATDVINFYILDKENPTSIISSVNSARENARSLRHLISTEMWTQINVFNSRMNELRKRDVQPRYLSAVCTTIKENCQSHTGITEGTFYRDQGWLFYWTGKMAERADQVSRLLDVGFIRGGIDEPRAVQGSQWNALLRSVAGYQAFRRTHHIRIRPHDVADFLLCDPNFPRSVLTCVSQVHANSLALLDQYGVESAKPALAEITDLRTNLVTADVPTILQNGLHDFTDDVQKRLIAFHNALKEGCFAHNG